MADNLIGPMIDTPLYGGMQVVLEAIHPDTGAAVSGVVVSNVVISGVPILNDSDVFIEVGAARLIPGPGA